jgi:hypothetical protein
MRFNLFFPLALATRPMNGMPINIPTLKIATSHHQYESGLIVTIAIALSRPMRFLCAANVRYGKGALLQRLKKTPEIMLIMLRFYFVPFW